MLTSPARRNSLLPLNTWDSFLKLSNSDSEACASAHLFPIFNLIRSRRALSAGEMVYKVGSQVPYSPISSSLSIYITKYVWFQRKRLLAQYILKSQFFPHFLVRNLIFLQLLGLHHLLLHASASPSPTLFLQHPSVVARWNWLPLQAPRC